MKAFAKYVKPEEYEIEITITLKMKEWEILRDSLPKEYPFWKLQLNISDAINELTRRTASDGASDD